MVKTEKSKASGHKWQFKARFRQRAFGWKSQPAITRVKQALAEIKKAVKLDPCLAAEGAVSLLERQFQPWVVGPTERTSTASNSPGRCIQTFLARSFIFFLVPA